MIIVKEIKEQLTNGQLVAGSKLPSVRQLAETFSCSKNTVLKAYSELEKAHLIYAIPQSGFYIVNDFKRPDNQPDVIDFLSAGPDKQLLPYMDFQHCLNQAIDTYKEELFTYSDQQGLPSLRTEIVKNLSTFTSIYRTRACCHRLRFTTSDSPSNSPSFSKRQKKYPD